jgi:hypothetical protein
VAVLSAGAITAPGATPGQRHQFDRPGVVDKWHRPGQRIWVLIITICVVVSSIVS